jgi:ASC-1-like (ASCH) protein
MTKKEVFIWIKNGTKTVNVRKGNPRKGKTAFFLSGPNKLRLPIVNKETRKLTEIIRPDNFKTVIPTAKTVKDALSYLRCLYETDEGVFTAYQIEQPQKMM